MKEDDGSILYRRVKLVLVRLRAKAFVVAVLPRRVEAEAGGSVLQHDSPFPVDSVVIKHTVRAHNR